MTLLILNKNNNNKKMKKIIPWIPWNDWFQIKQLFCFMVTDISLGQSAEIQSHLDVNQVEMIPANWDIKRFFHFQIFIWSKGSWPRVHGAFSGEGIHGLCISNSVPKTPGEVGPLMGSDTEVLNCFSSVEVGGQGMTVFCRSTIYYIVFKQVSWPGFGNNGASFCFLVCWIIWSDRAN